MPGNICLISDLRIVQGRACKWMITTHLGECNLLRWSIGQGMDQGSNQMQ